MTNTGPPIAQEVEKFTDKCLNQFLVDITDKIFLMIQGDYALKTELSQLTTTRPRVDADIGKLIKRKLDLADIGVETDPKSDLITKYTQHALK